MQFRDKLSAAQTHNNSWLCVGLDTDADKIPAFLHGDAVAFNRAIVQATSDLVCAYKPNLAFYLARGSVGIDALAQTVAAIPRHIPVILDAKFGDIESSARGYARTAFEMLGADAVTVSPYLGADALGPFLEYTDRAIFLLCHTSNPSAGELQDTRVGEEPLYVRVARAASTLAGEVGLVVGATFPDQLREARRANPHALFLIPGVGTQGGGVDAAVQPGPNDRGIGPVINASRAILYAASDSTFADQARAAALRLRDEINLKRKP